MMQFVRKTLPKFVTLNLMLSKLSGVFILYRFVSGFKHTVGRAVLLMLLLSGFARATDLEGLADLDSGQFETLVENIAAATHYKAVAPVEPLGLIGFDISVGASVTDIDSNLLSLASQGSIDSGALALIRASAHKGLPFGIDVGASLAALPGTDFRVLGAEVRYALLRGSVVTPALAVRGTYSIVSGSDELDVSNAGLEIGISKGFLTLTPYAGIGVIRSSADPQDNFGLSDTEVTQRKLFAGININLGFNLGLEAERTGDHTSVSAKAGFRF